MANKERMAAFILIASLCATLTSCKKPAESTTQLAKNPRQEQPVEPVKPKEPEINYLSRDVDTNRKEGLEALKVHDLDKAEKCYIAALQQIDPYPHQEARKAQITHDLGAVYEEKELYAEAIPLMNRSQKLFIRAYGRESPLVALTLSDLGRIMVKQKRFEEAVFVYKTAADLMEINARKAPDKFKDSYKDICTEYLKCLKVGNRALKIPAAEARLKAAEKL
ncbi:MAG: tetratricopeptide repeat protein [Candidatus Melainabacteria bacterium]|nr:tetratricopeptide repeat protein [Candidatus Melainabacteria bacterium]